MLADGKGLINKTCMYFMMLQKKKSVPARFAFLLLEDKKGLQKALLEDKKGLQKTLRLLLEGDNGLHNTLHS